MKYVYIAGPYMSHDPDPSNDYGIIERHINQAEEAAIVLSEHGIGFFCPHTHTAHFEVKSKAPESFYRQVGWEKSTGSKAERVIAVSLELPVFTLITDVIDWGKDHD